MEFLRLVLRSMFYSFFWDCRNYSKVSGRVLYLLIYGFCFEKVRILLREVNKIINDKSEGDIELFIMFYRSKNKDKVKF